MSESLSNAPPGEQRLQLDSAGRLAFTDALRNRWGFQAGAAVVVRQTQHGVLLLPADPPLGKVYVEPTSACNLNCRTCMRRSWTEPVGTMSPSCGDCLWARNIIVCP